MSEGDEKAVAPPARYQDVAGMAAALERAAMYAEAWPYWALAADLATTRHARVWCECRQAFCRHREHQPPESHRAERP